MAGRGWLLSLLFACSWASASSAPAAAILRAMREVGPRLGACVQGARPQGDAVVELRVGDSGRIDQLKWFKKPVIEIEALDCVERELQAMRFSPTELKAGTEFRLPLEFAAAAVGKRGTRR